jgi:DNA-binding transcriptional ArsR family regulator
VALTVPATTLGATIFALSDPLRRRVLEAVAANPGATVTEICAEFEASRFAVMRHLNVLEDSGLITREAVGRERRVRLSDLRFEDILTDWARGLRKDTK